MVGRSMERWYTRTKSERAYVDINGVKLPILITTHVTVEDKTVTVRIEWKVTQPIHVLVEKMERGTLPSELTIYKVDEITIDTERKKVDTRYSEKVLKYREFEFTIEERP